MSKIPGYESMAAFAREQGLEGDTVKRQMLRGVCKWPRVVRDGRRGHKMYVHYRSIIDRCQDKTHSSYKNYGGRGIRVCNSWFFDFWAFVEDITALGEKPDPSYTLDRIEVNGNYSPENVRWASKTLQSANQRMQKNNTSGRTGLSYSAKDNSWRVQRYIKGEPRRRSFKNREGAEAYLDILDELQQLSLTS